MSDATYISSDLEIEGDLESAGTVVICGSLHGVIKAHTVSVDRGGTLEGTVRAKVVVVGGLIEGQVACSDLRVSEFGEVVGDIEYSHLEVVAGGKLVGPLSVVATSG